MIFNIELDDIMLNWTSEEILDNIDPKDIASYCENNNIKIGYYTYDPDTIEPSNIVQFLVKCRNQGLSDIPRSKKEIIEYVTELVNDYLHF